MKSSRGRLYSVHEIGYGTQIVIHDNHTKGLRHTTPGTPAGPQVDSGSSGPRQERRPVTLRVSVTNKGGEFGILPLAGATVTVSQGSKVVYRGKTGKNGQVGAQLPSSGKYRVTAERTSYRRTSRSVSVGKSSQNLVITMPHQ